jgi:YQGE family putative transporter
MNDTKINPIALRQLISNFFYSWWGKTFLIFVNIVVWKETNDIQLIAICNILFNIWHVFAHTIWGLLLWKGLKEKISATWYLGIIGLYFFIVFSDGNIKEFIQYFFFGFGIFNGLYYISYNTTQFSLTNFKNRWHFEWLKKSTIILGSSIFPIIYWVTIGYYWLKVWLLLWICFLLISFYFSRKAKHDLKNNSVDIKKFFTTILKNKKIIYWLIGSFLLAFSFSQSLFNLLTSLLVYREVGNEIKLWLIISIIALITVFWTYAIGKLIDYKHYNKILLSFLSAYILSLYWLYNSLTIFYVSLFSALINIWIMWFSLLSSVISYNSLSSDSEWNSLKVEFTIVREIFLIAWWILAYIVLYYSGNINKEGLYILFLIIIIWAISTSIIFSKVKIHTINN